MTFNEILLVCAALLPAILLCIYVFRRDRVEKEPLGLLALLLLSGVIICFPAARLERNAIEFISEFFEGFSIAALSDGSYVLSDGMRKAYLLCKNIFGVALVEEGLKFLAMFFITRRNKNFNCLFDGIIYAVFVSLGFAAYENVLYVLQYGWINALARAVFSVPGHMFYGVIMGYYYSWWHIYKNADIMENELKRINVIQDGDRIRTKRFLVLSLVMPVIFHGIYDYCCSVGTTAGTVGLYVLVLFLYIYCFGKVDRISRLDTSSISVSRRVLLLTHPVLVETLEEKGVATEELTDDDALQIMIKNFED